MTTKAFVDEINNHFALLLLGEKEDPWIEVHLSALGIPVQEGDILEVELDEGILQQSTTIAANLAEVDLSRAIIRAKKLEAETDQRQQRARELMKRLLGVAEED